MSHWWHILKWVTDDTYLKDRTRKRIEVRGENTPSVFSMSGCEILDCYISLFSD